MKLVNKGLKQLNAFEFLKLREASEAEAWWKRFFPSYRLLASARSVTLLVCSGWKLTCKTKGSWVKANQPKTKNTTPNHQTKKTKATKQNHTPQRPKMTLICAERCEKKAGDGYCTNQHFVLGGHENKATNQPKPKGQRKTTTKNQTKTKTLQWPATKSDGNSPVESVNVTPRQTETQAPSPQPGAQRSPGDSRKGITYYLNVLTHRQNVAYGLYTGDRNYIILSLEPQKS